MGFFKNINANINFEALENYIKNKEWKTDNDDNYSHYPLGLFSGFWDSVTFNDFTWSFKLVNGTYMIDSCVLFEGANYRVVHEVKDYAKYLFQVMTDKKPIRIGAKVRYVDNRHITIRFFFDINNEGHEIIICDIRRKIKAENSEALYNPNYKFEHNYAKQQQKFAKRHTGRNKW